jgi:hypothetical protein
MQSHFPIHYHAPVLHCHSPSFLADTTQPPQRRVATKFGRNTFFRVLNFFPVSRRKLAKFWTSEPERASEGWLLLNVENEASGDSWSTNERGPSLIGSLGSSCRYKRFLSCIGCSIVGPVQKYFFLPVHYFNSFVPIAQQVGRQSRRVSCLLLCVSGIEKPDKKNLSRKEP